MTTLLQTVVGDIEKLDAVLPGFVLERAYAILSEALTHQGEAAVDRACASVEILYDRVLSYREGLVELEVPNQEKERHLRLLSAFSAYSDVLLGLLDALTGEETA